jgi:isopenicillin-N N-acyltransferase like protein
LPLQRFGELELLQVAGTPSEMGAEHGHVLRQYVHIAIDEYLRKCETALGIPLEAMCNMAKQAEPYIPSVYCEEMEALAVAAGVSYAHVLTLNCLPDIQNCLARGTSQCSNFVAFGPATCDGSFIHGRNLDFPHLKIIPKFCAVIARDASSIGACKTVSISWAGFVGTLTGINDQYVSIAEVSSMARESTMEGMPIAFLLREALENHGDLADITSFV